MKKLLFLLPTLFLANSCTKKDSEKAQTDGTIVTTIGMIADVTREIAGDKQEVMNLIGEGVDPHNHTPTKSEVDRIQKAGLVFYNGHLLEGKMGSLLDGRNKKGHPTFAVAEGLDMVELIGDENHPDPHLWMDVSIWTKVAENIGTQLTTFDPDHKDHYAERLEEYRKSLTDLHTYAMMALSTIPPDQRVLVDLVDFLVAKKIPAIFVESSVPQKSVRAVIEGAAAEGHIVKIGGELFSDAMGPAGSYEGTYIGMMDHNITTITNALGGGVPQAGFQNKLDD